LNSLAGVAVAEVVRESLPPSTVLGPYRILALLASGGMGDVYRARDERLGRDVALKVISPGITVDRERIDRFAQEAKAASALNHPNIVAIYEIGRDRPTAVVQQIDSKAKRAREIHYIAMELVDGQTLRDFLGTHPALPRRIELLAQMADGLGKAHGAGIVHRDLKPDNIMISHEGYAKIVDFGLAKLVEPARGWNPLGADSPTMRAITAQGEVIGTAGYMSPEQIVGKMVDQRSDIFSFGCIVYETVTGRRPFEGDSFVDTMHQVLHATPQPIDHHELQRIVGKCLVKDREYRYQSIRDVALDLRALARELEAPRAAIAAPLPKRRNHAAWIVAAACAAIASLVVWRMLPRPSAVAPARSAMQRITSNGHVSHLAASSDGRFVAYSTDDDKGQSVWLAQTATGSGVTVIPSAPKTYYAGLTFSADSNYLLTTSYDGTPYGTVHAVPILGGTGAKLVVDADTAASASPDGANMVITRDVLEHRESRVIITAKDGTNERIAAAFPLPYRAASPAWSPDGRRIAVAHGTSLYLIDPVKSTKKPVPVALNGWHGTIREIAWSGNDTLIVSAIDDRTAGHAQLFSVDLSDGRLHNITNDADDYFEPHMSATSIATIQAKRQATLWSVDPGSAEAQLTRGLASSDGLGGAAWTPDRHIVYTSSAAGPVDLWIANADGSDARQLTHDDALEFDPAVTRDGTSIVYITRDRTQWALWRMNVDGSHPQRLATSQAIVGLAVTPDSKRAVYATCSDGKGCALMSIGLDGSAPSTIAATGVFLRSLRITPDGRRVIFNALDDKLLKLFSVPIEGGKPAPFLPDRTGDASISPDGNSIAAIFGFNEAGAKLAIFEARAGAKPRVLDLNGSSYRWTADGRGIVFVRHAANTDNLFMMRLSDGQLTPVTHFTEGSIANLDVSPSGRILLTHSVETRDVVLLSN
jgi:serine/threonine protein kinase/dipeptidyl aminopeptidase/acylaminoacyl peptidase